MACCGYATKPGGKQGLLSLAIVQSYSNIHLTGKGYVLCDDSFGYCSFFLPQMRASSLESIPSIPSVVSPTNILHIVKNLTQGRAFYGRVDGSDRSWPAVDEKDK
jgi:hypothetical protein